MIAKYQPPDGSQVVRQERKFFWMIVALLMAVAIVAWVVFTPDEACAWGCGGHICVEDFDCPSSCSCARLPWEPSGECV